MKMSNLCLPQLHPHQETHATRTLVVPMPMLQCEALAASARVSQNILETPTLGAGQNVSSTLTVTGRLPVEETTNATTLALEHAATTLSAKCLTTTQRVPACQDTSEILSLAAV